MTTHVEESTPPNASSRLVALPLTALVVGATIGFVRNARATGLRFLAENAHRPPRTVKGWYFYNKTKNYRMLLGGMKGAAKESSKLVGTSLVWVGIEEGMKKLKIENERVQDLAPVVAGIGTGGVFGIVYRLGWRTTQQTVVLGGVIGAIVSGLGLVRKLA